MNKIAEMKIDLSALRAGACAGSLLAGTELQRFIDKPELVAEELRKVLRENDECTVVYYGCGSCENNGARVEYYCSSGASQPDYVSCEAC